jgi:hypothetical protein
MGPFREEQYQMDLGSAFRPNNLSPNSFRQYQTRQGISIKQNNTEE